MVKQAIRKIYLYRWVHCANISIKSLYGAFSTSQIGKRDYNTSGIIQNEVKGQGVNIPSLFLYGDIGGLKKSMHDLTIP